MRALVVGYGSIGQRHARLLRQLECEVAVVSRRDVEFSPRFADLELALATWSPGYVVLAGATAEHFGDLRRLAAAGFDGRVLVEKPLFDRPAGLPANRFSLTAVAYNLRFHPLVQRLRELLADDGPAVAAQISVGQYLPDWRPGSDYRESYSARRDGGGGVLRDLSHELDYLQWLFGRWRKLAAHGDHFSNLEIDSDDVFSLLLVTERCASVNLQLNYLDRTPRREIIVNTNRHTLRADLIGGVLQVDGREALRVQPDRDSTYLAEHRAVLNGNAEFLCSPAEAIDTVLAIDAAERASAANVWISI